MLQVQQAVTEIQLQQVRSLLWDYAAWMKGCYPDFSARLEAYFAAATYGAELAGLPGVYAPPLGRLLLARWEDQPAGCVALRPLEATDCEMKRMFVATPFQGHGVGRALAETLIREAQTLGYTRMRLEVGFRQVAAHGLYHSLGFTAMEPYYQLPEEAKGGVVFMELHL